MKRMIALTSLPVFLLGGCVTTSPERAAAERAACDEMEREMSLRTAHDHSEMKGIGRNPMNLSHDRCRQILAQPQ